MTVLPREENLVVILSREESWGPPSEHFSDGLYRVSCIMTLYLADTVQTKISDLALH
ncbi:Uncharacterised protein [Klebsiella pneumoniae]|nr:hypothetical protein AI2803V1_4922 [Klebsiella pneumoniae]CAH5248298.1 hypothetical protein AI2803V1_4922 [Klebsiella pneumoniae]SAV55482.1 Uncharacterised protein [Klebsiella pneumoniae]VAU30823.1 Uncharacterised protein [Klebsiella variicola]